MKKILRRGRLTIVVEPDKVTVFDSIQATLYAPYFSGNDNLFGQMKEYLLTSEDTEYSSWVDILTLASACRMYGLGTRVPDLTGFES